MKRFVSYFAVFIIGFAFCAWVLNHFYGFPSTEARIESVSMPRPGLKVASGQDNAVARAAAIVGEYVVNIDTTSKAVGYAPSDFFGFEIGPPREYIQQGKASGVVIDPNGYILTNNHVVEGANDIMVTLHNEKKYKAKLIGRDPQTEIAVIKIDARGLKAAKFDTHPLRVGDYVIAVGNALGLGPQVTLGVVSATYKSFDINGKVFERIVQTDAAINKGNSGGALADLNGNLVGINTAIASPTGGNIGIGFAISSGVAQRVAKQLIEHGRVEHPWIGIRYGPYNEDVRRLLRERGVTNLPDQDGIQIGEVIPGSPAAEAGLKPWDVVTKVNGKPLSGTMKPEGGKTTIAAEITKAKVGQLMELEVWHQTTNRTGLVGVRIGQMPEQFGE